MYPDSLTTVAIGSVWEGFDLWRHCTCDWKVYSSAAHIHTSHTTHMVHHWFQRSLLVVHMDLFLSLRTKMYAGDLHKWSKVTPIMTRVPRVQEGHGWRFRGWSWRVDRTWMMWCFDVFVKGYVLICMHRSLCWSCVFLLRALNRSSGNHVLVGQHLPKGGIWTPAPLVHHPTSTLN